ncbi:MAG: hypothetical protein V4608_10715 [Bacteroidota bacterium]
MRILLFVLLLSLSFVTCFYSCSTNTPNTNNSTNDSDSTNVTKNILTGQIIDRIACDNDSSQSFAVYLPKKYSSEKTYPVIYAFDPHGEGKLPISIYKDLAEQYGFILIGSNNSKNGIAWDESQKIAKNLFAETRKRFSINEQRIYLMGFSGGARIANALTIINGGIRGVICCGAAIPAANSDSPRGNYTFFGLVGNTDFNYTEMAKYDMLDLAGNNIKHILVTFDGKHEWPSKDIMNEGFWWLELNEMRKNISTKNDSLITEHIQPIREQLETYKQKKQTIETFNLSRKTINFYDGLTDLGAFYEAYKLSQSSSEVDTYLKQQEAMWAEEEKLKNEYIQALQKKDFTWWNESITKLNQKIKTGKTENALMNKRVLGFLSLAAYMQTSEALKQNVLSAAEFYSKIYLLVDPVNSEAHYFRAGVYAKQGDTKQAVNALSNAIKNGYTDLSRLQNDTMFDTIRNTTEFKEVTKGIPPN